MKIDEKFWEHIDSKKRKAIQEEFESEQFELSAQISGEIIDMMSQEKVSPAELARRLDSSRAHITNTIKPGHNMTLLTLAKFARALGYRVKIKFDKITEGEKRGESKNR